ncbi:MAG: carboxylesterase family protein [Eubacterium sp.]
MNYISIKTKCGDIKGLDQEDCYEFRGIKYADAKRWEYPVEIKQWQGEYDATHFGECAIQHRAYEDDATVNAFYHREFRKGLKFTYSEDCQFLNIYAPKNALKCPVLIYIHGGSYTGGSANEGHICGTKYAQNGVIFVSLNYRLGAFGFCSHPQIRNSEGICGNFGLYDQLTAISWVRNNIEAFGGDADSITLMGQSAGAMSVDILISSPMCKDWFKGAVLMSGGGIQRAVARPLTPEKTEKFWSNIMQNANASSMQELKNADARTVYEAWKKECKENKLSALLTLPVYDGKLVTKASFNMNTIPAMPKIIGITNCDMVPAVLEILAKKWVKKDKHSNDFVYLFDRDLPGDNKGAWHSADLLYAFSTLDFNWRSFEEIDYKISVQLYKSICAFAKNANPNCDEIPNWKPGTEEIMVFSESTKSMPFPTKRLIENTFSNRGSVV